MINFSSDDDQKSKCQRLIPASAKGISVPDAQTRPRSLEDHSVGLEDRRSWWSSPAPVESHASCHLLILSDSQLLLALSLGIRAEHRLLRPGASLKILGGFRVVSFLDPTRRAEFVANPNLTQHIS